MDRREFIQALLALMVGWQIASYWKSSADKTRRSQEAQIAENLHRYHEELAEVTGVEDEGTRAEVLRNTASWSREALFFHQDKRVTRGVVTLAQRENGEKCIVTVGHLLTDSVISFSLSPSNNISQGPDVEPDIVVFRNQIAVESLPVVEDTSEAVHYDGCIVASIIDPELNEKLFNNKPQLACLPVIASQFFNNHILNGNLRALYPVLGDGLGGEWNSLDIEPLDGQWSKTYTDEGIEIQVVRNMLTFRSRIPGLPKGSPLSPELCKGNSGTPGIVFSKLPGENLPKPYLWGVGASIHGEAGEDINTVVCKGHVSFATPYLIEQR